MQATFELLRRIDESLRSEVNINAFLFGGVAVHVYTGERPTTDVDVEFSERVVVKKEFINFMCDSKKSILYVDTQFNPMFSLLHEDYQADALPVPSRMKSIRLHVLSPTDLAVSKLARFSDNDQSDIVALASMGLIDADSVRRRANEALSGYVGDISYMKANISSAVKLIMECSQAHFSKNGHDAQGDVMEP
jgi:hypothetical protein